MNVFPETLYQIVFSVDIIFAVGGVLSSCTYTASVAANDTAGRIGNWSHVLFSFEGSSPPMSGCFFIFIIASVVKHFLLCAACKDELMNIWQLATSLRQS